MTYTDTLLQIITTSVPLLSAADPKVFVHQPNPAKWSKQQILGHLVDSAYNNHRRFTLATQQDHLIFDGYPQDHWVQANAYLERGLGSLIHTWAIVNEHLAVLLDRLPEEVLSRTTTEHNFHQICMNRIEEGAPTTLSYLVWDYLFHLEHHLQQLIATYHPITPPFSPLAKKEK